MSTDQRRAATEQLQSAMAAINTMFDRKDDLIAARDRFIGIEPLGPNDDPIRDVELLLGYAKQLEQALGQLRSAAVAASEHRRRSYLASDVGTTPSLLFGRTRIQTPVVATTQSSQAVDPERFDDPISRDVPTSVSA